MTDSRAWPALPYEPWADTCSTLHLWTQVIGKIRTTRTAWLNHSWHVPLYVTPRGMTTSPIPAGDRVFQLDLDFVDHRFEVADSVGGRSEFELQPMSVARFYHAVMSALDGLGLSTRIHPLPNEVENPIPFERDEEHGSYDREAVERFHQVMVSVDRVFKRFRAGFLGKCSPVHFFWGSFDLAVTRFSGRTAPEHPGGIPNLPDWITREAYSHEVSSAGFWPGGAMHPHPIFYSYAYPTPEGFSGRAVRPDAATWFDPLGEFVLDYEAVRTSPDPEAALMAFLEDTYIAAAETGGWDRGGLEWDGTGVPERRRQGVEA